MKTYIKIVVLLVIIVFTSCEDVIDVDLQEVPPRLVIEASIDWEKGTLGNEQIIALRTSTPYFKNTEDTSVTGASVIVTNDTDGTEFVFVDQNNGVYATDVFVPIINQSYTLEVIYNGEMYTATETLMPVPDINEIYQSTEEGFDDELLEVNLTFLDPEEEENYYIFGFQRRGDLFVRIEEVDDQFINGNEVNWWFEKEEEDEVNEKAFEIGDIVDIEFYGVSEAYSNYIRILIEQSEGIGLFGTTPVALRGNCINIDNKDNYAHGFFRVTQFVKASYTFE